LLVLPQLAGNETGKFRPRFVPCLFPSLRFQIGIRVPLCQLHSHPNGPLPLDVCHVLIHDNSPVRSAADALRNMQSLFDAQLGPLPPGEVKGKSGTEGFGTNMAVPEGSYYIQINTRNDRFYETLTIHPNVPGKALETIEVRNERGKLYTLSLKRRRGFSKNHPLASRDFPLRRFLVESGGLMVSGPDRSRPKPAIIVSRGGKHQMGNLSVVVRQLAKERSRLADELHRVTAALTAFGKAYISSNHRKRTFSVAGRKRIAAAQRARWAKQKQAKKPKQTISVAGRKRIAAAQRARWAKVKSQQKKAA
jgi:hypothetical protein